MTLDGDRKNHGPEDPSGSPASAHKRTPATRRKRSPFFRTRRRTIVTILVTVPLLLCLVYWLLGFVAFRDSATMIQLKGLVQARKEKEPKWDLAHLNQFLRRDHRVRTGSGSGARLLFFDISTVDLGENTEVSILQVSKRRGGNAVNVVIKTWVGKTAVRAVRFVDPSSTLRVETPTASTVVRGARLDIVVAEDGTTQIDIQQGSAQVEVDDEVVDLRMGERITLDPSGDYKMERVFEPDAQLVFDQVAAAWSATGSRFQLELDEAEVNQFMAALSQDADFFLQDAQIWFLDGEARVAAKLVRPVPLDLSTAIEIRVVDGQLDPHIKSVAAGVVLPVPAPILNLAVDLALSQVQEYLAEAYSYVEFSDVQIRDGELFVSARKQPGAPGN